MKTTNDAKPTHNVQPKSTEKKLTLKKDTVRLLGIAPSQAAPGHTSVPCFSGTGHLCC